MSLKIAKYVLDEDLLYNENTKFRFRSGSNITEDLTSLKTIPDDFNHSFLNPLFKNTYDDYEIPSGLLSFNFKLIAPEDITENENLPTVLKYRYKSFNPLLDEIWISTTNDDTTGENLYMLSESEMNLCNALNDTIQNVVEDNVYSILTTNTFSTPLQVVTKLRFKLLISSENIITNQDIEDLQDAINSDTIESELKRKLILSSSTAILNKILHDKNQMKVDLRLNHES